MKKSVRFEIGILCIIMLMSLLPVGRAELPGTWVCADGSEEFSAQITSQWIYSFRPDGQYDYFDGNTGYQEHGSWQLINNQLFLTRDDGGIEEYEVSFSDEMLFWKGAEETVAFLRQHDFLSGAK